ncbi:hypothetical protein SAMN04490355_101447 [Pelosinus propionicus DSM 13327]|uniref:Transposase, Mutator family n=1 Tax=Pelosinus propionicus DSM 13327 TaxID=1123291 RepID=A0A1I4JVE9_9FIRM|nr:hypothetical protein SAMN04490355_101447 [Pelosinus propionicus DSM 13327]
MADHLGYDEHNEDDNNTGNSKKHESTSNAIEEQIIGMYAKCMPTRDIEDQLRDIYGIDVSP